MPDPRVTELTPEELELGTVDPANFPYQKQRGMLYWTGSAWAKWDGSVTISDITPGTGATDLGKAEDAAHTTGDTGVMALGVRNDGGAASAANGDYIPIPVSEFSSVVGVPVHVVGDSDKYVRQVQFTTAGTSTSVSIGVGGATVLASNASRMRAIICNYGAVDCFLKFGATPATNSGIYLAAKTGTLVEDAYTGIITGITASGTATVGVTEY